MMRFTRIVRDPRALLVTVGLGLGGCNQLEKIDDAGAEGGGGDEVPAAVEAAFVRSCASSPACHAGGPAPALDGNIGALIGAPSSTGIPMVTIGNSAQSYIAIKMLPDDVLAGLGVTRMGARMPLGYDFGAGDPNTLADTLTILAWIGGADFGDAGGTGDEMTGGDPTGDDSTSTGGEPLAPTFTNINDTIITPACSCHLTTAMPGNGNLDLTAGNAYANIFEKKSTQATTVNLITPGDPAASYFYLKLTGEFMMAPGGTGSVMPQGGMLTDEQILLVEEWILAGAMND